MNKLDSLTSIIPFLNLYPLWARVIILICFIIILSILIFAYPKSTPKTLETTKTNGDYVKGDKIINYGTFIKQEIAKTDESNIVTEEIIKDFFLRMQLSLAEMRKTIPRDQFILLPSYLQKPYDTNITISNKHGVGFEFITPSQNPEINISKTNMPIEQYYFSKYTKKENYSNAQIFRIGSNYIVISNFILVGGKKMIAVGRDGDVLLKNIGIKYAKDDTTKEIEFLRLFGNNQKDYWIKLNPNDQAKFLFNVK
ncbi:MAG: hypothetical protein KAU58_05225 [Candidatus Omnitrophica bacterium]|nr:hypothetical protein [Candidatus Omnitrophota bacterium]